jgi:hypothetical protein
MGQEAIGQEFDALLDAVAEAVTDTSSLFQRPLVVLLQQALMGILDRARESGAVQQAVEEGKIVEALFIQDLPQVELDIGLPADVGAVAEEAEGQAVGDQAPEVLGAVEELLDEGVRCQAGSSAGWEASQFLAGADEVHRWGIFHLPGTMRDGKAGSIHVVGTLIIVQLIAQQAEKGDHPGVACDGSCQVGVRHAFQAVLEDLPLLAGIRKGGGDLIGERTLAVEAKVPGLLPGQLAGQEFLEDVRPQQASFQVNGRKLAHGDTTG